MGQGERPAVEPLLMEGCSGKVPALIGPEEETATVR